MSPTTHSPFGPHLADLFACVPPALLNYKFYYFNFYKFPLHMGWYVPWIRSILLENCLATADLQERGAKGQIMYKSISR